MAPHERFERHGDDLYCRVSIDSLEAITGTTLEMDGILANERVTIEVPAGCAYGAQVRVSDKGMPRMGGAARGSVIAVVEVVPPEQLTPEQLSSIAAIVSERACEREGAGAE